MTPEEVTPEEVTPEEVTPGEVRPEALGQDAAPARRITLSRRAGTALATAAAVLTGLLLVTGDGGGGSEKAAAVAPRPKPAATTSTSTTTTLPPTTTTVTTEPPTSTTVTAAAPVVAPAPVLQRAPSPPPPAPAPLTLASALGAAFGPHNGCLMVEQDGVVVYERNPAEAFVPASSQKLLVGAAVLSRLGPEYRYETKVVARERPDSQGRVPDVWLVGSGDPYLSTPEYMAYVASKPRLATLPLTPMTALADALVAAGVKDVPGGLHADESHHDTQRSVPTWKPSYVSSAEVGSLGALTVNEGLASWGPSQRVSPDPAVDATTALAKLLSERGVTSPGAVIDGNRKAPDDTVVLATVRSAPLADIVAATIRASDNYAAEMIMRELDRRAGGPGSTAGGAVAVAAELARAGVEVGAVHLNDGSGLDTGNRATCRALLGAITLTGRAPYTAMADGLAVAGRSGTLAARWVGTPIEGKLAAKTGWINGAGALVGRLEPVGPGVPSRRFALVVNGGFNYATSKEIQDRVVQALATLP